MPNRSTLWIVDGHNVIFAIPELRALQAAGHRTEARQGLVDDLRSFAAARGGERFLVVFDGQDVGAHPGVERGGLVEVIYGAPRGGGADALILRDAELHLARGSKVFVVTNDVATIAKRLPDRARHMRVASFVKEMTVPAEGVGDLSDEEKRRWIESDEVVETSPRGRERLASRSAAGRAAQPPPSPEEAARARLREKKEKGRLRHARRMEGRKKTAQRR